MPPGDPFTSEEDAALLSFVDSHGKDWPACAASLTTGRTPKSYATRYNVLRPIKHAHPGAAASACRGCARPRPPISRR